MEGQEGRGRKEKEEKGEGYPLRMKILATGPGNDQLTRNLAMELQLKSAERSTVICNTAVLQNRFINPLYDDDEVDTPYCTRWLALELFGQQLTTIQEAYAYSLAQPIHVCLYEEEVVVILVIFLQDSIFRNQKFELYQQKIRRTTGFC